MPAFFASNCVWELIVAYNWSFLLAIGAFSAFNWSRFFAYNEAFLLKVGLCV